MSTTVDQRVVEMRFDNQHFERNVSTTLSTLDKLKQSLKLPDASKGLNSLSNAAKNVDMNSLGRGVEDVRMRFSALEVMGVTALANITNSAVNAGKRIVSALTIDPVKTGFQEYETQINAVQTILANTQSKGTSIDDVNRALDELNTYADKTIYNFTEMTRNIGTFTAAGVDLDTSVSAIQGIANLAAVSGSTSQQASTAMYQLSQALATGTVKLQDWNSVVNAGMGGEVFQNALVQTAAVMAGASEDVEAWRKKNIDSYGSFRDSLTQGEWLTTEVLTATLNQFTMAAEEGSKEWEKYKQSLMETGYTEKQAEEILKMANTATDAATKVKTFTQLWDVLKESAQSGWSQTWKLIIGDFEEAKSLLTPLADFLTGFVNKMSDFRNDILESALGRTFNSMGKKISDILAPATKATEAIKGTVDTITDLGEIVDKVILGKFGNGKERFDALSKAGINYYEVQNKVNEKLNNGKRYTQEQIDAQNKLLGTQSKAAETTKKQAESTEKQAEATVKLNDEQKKLLKKLGKMSDEQLRAAGYSEKQIKALNELKSTAEDLGIPFGEFIDKLDEINGRWLLMNSFKNIGQGLVDVGNAIGQAWKDIFPEHNVENFANKLFNLLGALHKFSSGLTGIFYEQTGTNKAGEAIYELTDAGDKLVRTFKGVFAVLDIITTIVGGGLKIGFKVLTEILSYFNLGILDATAIIGDVIVGFRDWLDSLFNVSEIIGKVIPYVEKFVNAIRDMVDMGAIFDRIGDGLNKVSNGFRNWINSLKDSKNLPKDIAEGIASGFKFALTVVQNFFKKIPELFKNGFSTISDSPITGFLSKITSGLKIAGQTIVELGKIVLNKVNEFLTAHGFEEISVDCIAGLVNGFKNGATAAWNAAVEMVTTLVQKVKDFLGIHSPSTVFMAIGGFIIAGLIMGLQNGIPDSLGAIKDVFQPMLDWIKDLDFGAIMAAVIGLGTLRTVSKAVDAIAAFAAPLEGLGNVFDGTGEVLKKSAKPIAKVIKNTAKVVKSFSKVLNGVAFSIKADAIKTLATSLLMLVAAIAILTFFDPKELWNAVGVIAALSVILVGLAFALDKVSNATASASFKDGINIKGLSAGLTGIAMALLLMAATVKMVGSLNPEQAKQGFLGLAGLIVAVGVVIAAFGLLVKGKSAQNIDKFGKSMTKLAVALLLMAVVVKMLGGMDQATLEQGGKAIAQFVILIGLIMGATRLIGRSSNVGSIGGTLLKIALAIGVMALVVKSLGTMEQETLEQGGKAIAQFVILIGIIMGATRLISRSKRNVDAIGSTLLKIALAIAAMGLVVKMLGGMDNDELIRGGVAVAALVGMIVGLMAATKLIAGTRNVGKIGVTLLAISGAIAILAATAFMLSMISWEGFAKGTIMVTAFAGIMVGLMAATRLVGGKDVADIGKTLISVAGAIGILALIAVLVGLVPVENLKRGVAVVAILSGLMAGLIAVTSIAKNCLGNIIALTVAIAVITSAVYMISKIPAESAITSALILGGLMVVMTGALAALSLIGKHTKNALFGVLALTAMALPLFAFVKILTMMNGTQNATNNVKALVILTTALTLLLVPLSLVGALAKFALMGVVALTAMAIPLLAFVGVLALMSNIQNGIENAKALTELMGAIGDILFKISLVAPLAVIGVGALAGMLGLITALGIVATAIGALIDKFPQLETFLDKGIGLFEEISYGLGNAIGSFIAGIGEGLTSSLPTIGQNIADFMDKLALASENASGIESGSFDGVADLISVMGDIALMTVGTSVSDLFTLGGTSMDKFETDGVAFFEAMKSISSAAAGITVNEDGMNTVIGIATKLVDLQSSLEPIGGVIDWFTGRDDLATFGKNIGVFIGSMTTSFSSLDGVTFNTEALSSIIDASSELSKLQSSLEPIGGVISWFTGRDDLATFGINVGLFIVSMKTALSSLEEGLEFNTEALNAIISAATKLSELQSSLEPIGGVISWFTGRDDLGTFGENVGLFIGSMSTALSSMGDTTINTDTLTSIISAASKLAELQSTLKPMGGVIDWFTGRDDLGTFGENIATFASAMGKLKEGMGEDGISEAVVTSVTNAGNALIALNNALPEEGFFDSKITMTEFADYISDFSTAISDFSTKASEINSEGINTAITAAYRIKSLIASVADIDVSGVATFTGVGTGGFGADGPMSDIADAIVVFSNKVAEVDATAISTSVNTAMKLKNLINGLVDLDTSGIETFKKVKDIGGVIGDYADNVGEIDTATLSSSISAANRLKNFVNGLADIDTSGVSKFKIGTIGTSLKSYAGSVADVNSTAISSSVTAANKLKNFINSLADLDASGVGSFKTAISELGSVSIENIVTAFSNSTTALTTVGSNLITAITNGMSAKQTALVTMVTTLVSSMHTSIMSKAALFLLAGSTLMTMLAAGMSAKKTAVATAAASSMSSAISSARSHYISFYNAGSYLVSGFANGISANSYKAAAKARAMAKAAKNAAEDALGIASPSKVFYKIGDYTGQGFINALTDYADKSYSAGSEMATSARNGLNNAIGKITDLISGDMDIQPTIRPVLDLSDVESGANTISSILGSGTPVSVLSGVNAINANMNRRSQNRDAGEIVAAINKLRKDLGNVGNTTYSINGVTYDDGSGITDAVKTIVRAAKIERRV